MEVEAWKSHWIRQQQEGTAKERDAVLDSTGQPIIRADMQPTRVSQPKPAAAEA